MSRRRNAKGAAESRRAMVLNRDVKDDPSPTSTAEKEDSDVVMSPTTTTTTITAAAAEEPTPLLATTTTQPPDWKSMCTAAGIFVAVILWSKT